MVIVIGTAAKGSQAKLSLWQVNVPDSMIGPTEGVQGAESVLWYMLFRDVTSLCSPRCDLLIAADAIVFTLRFWQVVRWRQTRKGRRGDGGLEVARMDRVGWKLAVLSVNGEERLRTARNQYSRA
jgi:hypothetical protein